MTTRHDDNASGHTGGVTDDIAGLGGAYNSAPRGYATKYFEVPVGHGEITAGTLIDTIVR